MTYGIAIFIVLYFFTGTFVAIAYILAYKPEDDRSTTWLGLTVILWPLALALDVVLTLASGFGRTAKIIHSRLKHVSK